MEQPVVSRQRQEGALKRGRLMRELVDNLQQLDTLNAFLLSASSTDVPNESSAATEEDEGYTSPTVQLEYQEARRLGLLKATELIMGEHWTSEVSLHATQVFSSGIWPRFEDEIMKIYPEESADQTRVEVQLLRDMDRYSEAITYSEQGYRFGMTRAVRILKGNSYGWEIERRTSLLLGYYEGPRWWWKKRKEWGDL